jgi:hypothetical protein
VLRLILNPWPNQMRDDEPEALPFLPSIPLLPNPAPPVVEVVYSYEQLKKHRLASAPLIVRATYDEVQRMIEDGILAMQERAYEEWYLWVLRNV